MLFFKCGYFLKVLFNKRLSSPFFAVKSVARVQKKINNHKIDVDAAQEVKFSSASLPKLLWPFKVNFFLLYFLFFLARVKDFAEEEGRLLTVYVYSKMRNKVNFMHAGLFQISKIHSWHLQQVDFSHHEINNH